MSSRSSKEAAPALTGETLEPLYAKLNRREFVHPDPLEFLYRYEGIRDREIAGLVASTLAYGNVKQILRSVSAALSAIDPPHDFLMNADRAGLFSALSGFKHRFTDGEELAMLLWGAKLAVEKFGSLEKCFAAGMADNSETLTPAMEAFAKELLREFENGESYLLPLPSRGSVCKRFNLYLRWMVRHDEVDPGGWTSVSASKLLIPLDTHMWKICSAAGFTSRRQPNLKAVLEITRRFREIRPDDPARFDFALTRFGIRDRMKKDDMLRRLQNLP